MPPIPGHRRRRAQFALLLPLLAVLLCGGGYLSVSVYPSLGAKGAEVLRNVFGDEAVARLEGLVFQVQDTVRRVTYRTSNQPAAPWALEPVPVQTVRIFTSTPATPAPTSSEVGQVPAASLTPVSNSGTEQPALATASVSTSVPAWSPPAASALGKLEGEGQWSGYIQNSDGQTVAFRAFFQPDAERPYAVPAVVAFDLSRVRLHYILGIDEPTSDVAIDRPGVIPSEDLQPGVLLAVFNGGFKGRHGRYGVMVNGIEVIPPRPGMGTLVLYKDGRLRMGAWGQDIQTSANMLAWRQNGPLLLENGQINPATSSNSTLDWGSTVDGEGVVPTWRSAIGLSADGNILYYAAGPSLTIPALARTLQAAGAAIAIQLDINNYWVHFGAIEFNGDKPKTLPLFPQMNDNPDRYLLPYTRDFFYVTANP